MAVMAEGFAFSFYGSFGFTTPRNRGEGGEEEEEEKTKQS